MVVMFIFGTRELASRTWLTYVSALIVVNSPSLFDELAATEAQFQHTFRGVSDSQQTQLRAWTNEIAASVHRFHCEWVTKILHVSEIALCPNNFRTISTQFRKALKLIFCVKEIQNSECCSKAGLEIHVKLEVRHL